MLWFQNNYNSNLVDDCVAVVVALWSSYTDASGFQHYEFQFEFVVWIVKNQLKRVYES